MNPHAFRASSAIAVVLSVGGCALLDKKGKTDDAGTAVAEAAAPVASVSAAPNDGSRSIDGIGVVPPWAADKPTAKCDATTAAKTRFHALEKGDDATISAGTADVAAMVKDVGADGCFAARKGLADGLNNGGYTRYHVKKFDEASRWWRDAVTVRPGFLLARYNLACGLALASKPKDAVAELLEIARASKEGDIAASSFLEKAKTDDDLKTVRDDASFKDAIKVSQGTLIGPRKGSSEPEVGAKAIPLLPDEFRKIKDTSGVSPSGVITYKPAVVNLWTWHPQASTELVVTTITDDPSMLGKPRGDVNFAYGAIAVYRRDGEKLALLLARKMGEAPPAVAAGKNGAIAYTFEQACGALTGTLTWTGSKVEVHERTCQDL